jgi:hypothetical protein
MLADKSSQINDTGNVVPKVVLDWLLDKRLARPNGEQVEFQHDTVRDYLAACYFSDEWDLILKDEKSVVGKHWLPMLEFALGDAKFSSYMKEIFPALLARNVQVAGILFKRWRAVSGASIELWETEFLTRFGEATLEAG